jgi:hypothetical protein
VEIRNNTVANNDSTATTALAFAPGDPNESLPQPAGIVSHLHGSDMGILVTDVTDAGGGTLPGNGLFFSDPTLSDTIVLHNRSFYWVNNAAVCNPGADLHMTDFCLLPDPTTPVYDDLAVMDGTVPSVGDLLNPQYSMLTDSTPYGADNIDGDTGNADFVNGYFNVGRDSTLLFAEGTVLQTAGAFDEGGNFIQVSYGPLSLLEPGAVNNPANNTTLFDYHLCLGDDCSLAINAGQYRTSGSPALKNPPPALLAEDFDNDTRPTGRLSDIGADEQQ